MIEVHEDEHHQGCLEARDDETDGGIDPIEAMSAKVQPFHRSNRNGNAGEKEQEQSNEQIEFLFLLNFFDRISHGKIIIESKFWVREGLHQVEDRKEEDPNQVHKVPEESADLDPVGKPLGI